MYKIMSTFVTGPSHVSDQTHTNSSYSIHEYWILAYLIIMPLS